MSATWTISCGRYGWSCRGWSCNGREQEFSEQE
jgi:hypothetical protein